MLKRCAGGVLLVCSLVVLEGCAPSRPGVSGQEEARTPAERDTRARTDTTRREAAPDLRAEGSLEALRASYVKGNYEAVVRRARGWQDEALDAAAEVSIYTLLGRAEQARGRHEAAIDALRRARVAATENGQTRVAIDRALGESYVARVRWPQAASAFRRVLDARPDDRAARQALAEVYRRSRQWKEARTQYRALVQADSTNGRWWARLGQCTLEVGASDRALRHFAAAHRHLPQAADVALPLSRLYRANGSPDAARRVVDTTLAHQAGDPRLWRRKADLAFEQDDLDASRRAYRRTIATGDSSATVYRRIGLIDVRQGQHAQALPFLHRSLRRDSTHARTTLYLGVAYLKLDSLQQAVTMLQRTVDRSAHGPLTRALEQLGTAQSQREHVSEAVHAYRTALRLRPERAALYFHLAAVYDEHYRDKRPAARYYRRFLRVAESDQRRLRSYAESRLKTLRSTLHMQRGAQGRSREGAEAPPSKIE